MPYAARPFVALLATALALASWPLPSSARHGGRGAAVHRHGHGGAGLFWGGLGIAIGLGAVHHSLSQAQRGDAGPGAYASPLPDAPLPGGAPDPMIYPRTGQSAWQTEADRQDCNRWATTQPDAMADATAFQQLARDCMDQRGYTTR